MKTWFESFWNLHGKWSEATFGTARDHTGPLSYLRREIDEIAKNPDDIEEFADAFMLILDSARRAGHNFDDFKDACYSKLIDNIEREWPDTPDKDGVFEHIKKKKES